MGGIIRDFLGPLTFVAVAFSVFANQVALEELSGDTRSVLTFADHVSMSIDHFFWIFVTLAFLSVFAALGVALGDVIGRSGRLLGRTYGGLRDALAVIGRRERTPHTVVAADGGGDLDGVFRSLNGKAHAIEFRVAMWTSVSSLIRSGFLLLALVWACQVLIGLLSGSNVTSIWSDGALYSGAMLGFGGGVLVIILALRRLLWGWVVISIDGTDVKDEEVLKTIFDENTIRRIRAQEREFWWSRYQTAQRRIGVIFAVPLLIAAAYVHGVSFATSHYYRMLVSDVPTDTEAVPAERLVLRGAAVIRVIEQGALYYDAERENIVFVNDEDTIEAHYPLRWAGVEAIGTRPSCPLGRVWGPLRFLIEKAFVLDDLVGWRLGSCRPLAQVAAEKRTAKEEVGLERKKKPGQQGEVRSE